MNKRTKVILIIIVLVIIFGFSIVFGPCCMLFPFMAYQQRKGSNYLDSITEKDISVWVERTEKYLKEYDPNEYGIGVYGSKDKPVPEDYENWVS